MISINTSADSNITYLSYKGAWIISYCIASVNYLERRFKAYALNYNLLSTLLVVLLSVFT